MFLYNSNYIIDQNFRQKFKFILLIE